MLCRPFLLIRPLAAWLREHIGRDEVQGYGDECHMDTHGIKVLDSEMGVVTVPIREVQVCSSFIVRRCQHGEQIQVLDVKKRVVGPRCHGREIGTRKRVLPILFHHSDLIVIGT